MFSLLTFLSTVQAMVLENISLLSNDIPQMQVVGNSAARCAVWLLTTRSCCRVNNVQQTATGLPVQSLCYGGKVHRFSRKLSVLSMPYLEAHTR